MTFKNVMLRLRVSVPPWPVSVAVLAAGLVAAAPAAAQRAPAPVPTNLSTEVLSLACKPGLVFEAPPTPLRVTGSQESVIHRTFAPDDLITINAGTDNRIDVGQEFYTRRAVPIERRPISRDNPVTNRTSGWIRVYAVDKEMSLATITLRVRLDRIERLSRPVRPARDPPDLGEPACGPA